MSNRKKIDGVSCFGRIPKNGAVSPTIIVSAGRLEDNKFVEFVWPNEVVRWTQLVPQVKTWAEAFGFDIDEVWSIKERDLKKIPSEVKSKWIPRKQFMFIKKLSELPSKFVPCQRS